MIDAGALLLVLTLAVPLALVPCAALVGRPLRLLPLAPLPGLVAAVVAPSGTAVQIPPLLLGMRLALDPIGAVFLGCGALVWLLAAVYAGRYLAASERAAAFAAFWLLTLAGSLGTFVAADVVSFYVAFSLVSLAAYGLVIHDRTAAARRAGRVYIVVAVIGELALFAALVLATTAAGDTGLREVTAALATAPWRDAGIAALVVGLGIKAGLVPLHVWLPLAHPEAPTPASAALSGVIVKAGIIGLIRLLPWDQPEPAWGAVLVGIGLVTAYYGVAIGVLQDRAKAILAYSTLSQMGLAVAVLGHGLGHAAAEAAIAAVTLACAHHGLAKAALFLATGVIATSRPRAVRPLLAVTAIVALGIAGLPLTGGALAKLALKAPLGDGTTALLVTLTAVTTALLMLRAVSVLGAPPEHPAVGDGPPRGLLVPWALTALAALVVPWLLFPVLSGRPLAEAVAPAALWAALWPVLIAALIAAVVRRRWRAPPVQVPTGDLVVIAERAAGRLVRTAARISRPEVTAVLAAGLARLGALAAYLGEVVEERLRSWHAAAPVLLLLAVLIGIALRS